MPAEFRSKAQRTQRAFRAREGLRLPCRVGLTHLMQSCRFIVPEEISIYESPLASLSSLVNSVENWNVPSLARYVLHGVAAQRMNALCGCHAAFCPQLHVD
eukprot:scaffold20903_cov99-Isochrysis_galbana.AAC.5